MGSDLLNPDFVRELEALRRRLEVRARSGASGERAARRKGGSAEFLEHRAYTAGDDLRRVDWLAFARTGEPVLKLFRAEEDAVVRLLVDASASLDFGDPQKLDVARRLAAAIGYMALAGSQRVQVAVARDRDGATTGKSSLEQVSAPRRGRASLPALLRDLAAARPLGSLNLARSIDQMLARSTKPGLLVVVSDFFDAGPVIATLSRARTAGYDVSLVQVVDRSEVEPQLEGDFTLEDAETSAPLDVTMDPTAIQAYITRFAGLVEELRSWSRQRGASYIRVLTDEPLEAVVRRFVARTID